MKRLIIIAAVLLAACSEKEPVENIINVGGGASAENFDTSNLFKCDLRSCPTLPISAK